MTILKSINNNVVSALDEDGREVVLMGRGIGFHAKAGKKILSSQVEKVFYMQDQSTTDKFKELLKEMPLEHIEVSDDIISYAKKILAKELNETIYITLTDHISFAVKRFKKGMLFQNALLMEVRRFYPEEYAIGEYALEMIHADLGIRFPSDEAASIALHLVNAEYDTSLSGAVDITRLAQDILELVEEEFDTKLDRNSTYYERFITHLKFLAQRIFKDEHFKNKDIDLYKMIFEYFPEEYQCGKKIAEFVKKQFDYEMSEEEVSYLTLHIRRLKNNID